MRMCLSIESVRAGRARESSSLHLVGGLRAVMLCSSSSPARLDSEAANRAVSRRTEGRPGGGTGLSARLLARSLSGLTLAISVFS